MASRGAAIRDFNFHAPGFGEAYKKSLLDPLTTVKSWRLWRKPGALGELRGDRSQRQGHVRNPRLRMHMTYGENERAMVQDMADSAAEMLEAAGAKNIRPGHETQHSRLGDP